MSEVWTREQWCKGFVGHPESNERDKRGINGETVWGNSAGNRLSFQKQNLHRARALSCPADAIQPCRLLSNSTSSQVMQDVPHDACHNSLMLRCYLWNRTKHYVYCNKCRGGGGRNLGERKKRERFTTPLKIIAIGPHVHSDSSSPIPDYIPAIPVQMSPRRS
jgi:hypothetical protein